MRTLGGLFPLVARIMVLKLCAVSNSLQQRGSCKMTIKKARSFSLFALFFSAIAVWYFFNKNIQNVDLQSFFIAVSALVLSGMVFSYITDRINRAEH